MLKGIVKVGESGSEVKFNSTKMLRALSLSDVKHLLSDDISFVVVERAKETDRSDIEALQGKVKVYLFKSDAEFDGLTNYGNLRELQRDISFTYGVNVRTYRTGVAEEEELHREAERQAREAERLAREAEQAWLEELARQEELERQDKEKEFTSEEETFDDLFSDKEFEDGVPDNLFADDPLADALNKTNEESRDKISGEVGSEGAYPDGLEVFDGSSNSILENNESGSDVSELSSEESKNQLDHETELREPEEINEHKEFESDTDSSDAEGNALELAQALLASNVEEDEEPVEEERHSIILESVNEFIWNDLEVDESTQEKVDSAEVENLKRMLEVTTDRLDKLIAIRNSLLDKLGFYENLVRNIEVQESVIDVQTKDSEETLAKLRECKLIIKDNENKIIELQRQLGKIDELHLEIEAKNKEIDDLHRSLQEARTDDRYKEVQSALDFESDIRQQVLGLTLRVATGYEEAEAALKDAQAKIRNLTETNARLTDSVVDMNKKLDEASRQKDAQVRKYAERVRMLNIQLDEYSSKLNSANNEVRRISKEYEEALDEKCNLENENTRYKQELTDSRSRLLSANNELEMQYGEVSKLKKQLKVYEDMDIEQLKEDVAVSNIGQSQLQQQLGRLQKTLKATEYQLSRKDETISALQEENSRLTLTNKGLSRSAATAESLTIDIEYRGRAAIIPVFGTGGSGATTLAISVAERLDGSVLLLDFDCAKPSLERFAGLNPMIKELPGLSAMDQSAFSALIHKGTDYVIDNRDLVIRRIASKNKDGIFYFSGVYNKVDLSEFLSIEFDQFLNFFGNEYKYIVVDLGSINGSESNVSLIRAFNKIAWKNLYVCKHDKYDVRLAKIKGTVNQLLWNKTKWILNFAKNTKLERPMENALRGHDVYFMALEPQYFGEIRKYSEYGNPNKDRIRELAEIVRC